MKRLVATYSFNASAKTITFPGFTTLELERILIITNVTRNTIIYNFASTGGTVSGNILTLSSSLNTTGMANTDKLQIFYDYPESIGSAGTANTDVSTVQGIAGGVPLSVDLGTKITDATMPTGGGGSLGWLSAIWKLISDRIPALGQALAAASTPVVLPAAQITALTPPTTVAINNSLTLAAESGYLTYRNTALTNTSVQVKASSGTLMGWNFINVNPVTVYVKFYNLATGVTVGTSPVLLTQAVPGGSASNPGINFLEVGLIPQEVFSTGISMACVTGLADSSTTAPTTSIHASVRYK